MIRLSALKKLTIGGIPLKQLFINGIQVWKTGCKNWVPLSINPDGTGYNNGLGYKNGYRVRSGGAEEPTGRAACTGFIPVNGGDVIRIKGWDRYHYPGSAANAINVSDGNFTNIGQVGNANYGIFTEGYGAYGRATIEDAASGISTWVAPPAASGIAYIRVSGYSNDFYMDGANIIVSINEEIE